MATQVVTPVFDPDAFMATRKAAPKVAFDPDGFMASRAGAAPEQDSLDQQQEAAKATVGAPTPKPVLPKPEFGPESPQEALLHGSAEQNYEQSKVMEPQGPLEAGPTEGTTPLHAFVKQAVAGTTGDVMRRLNAMGTPENAALAYSAPAAPEVALPYYAIQSGRDLARGRQSGENLPDELERRGLDLAGTILPIAGLGETIKQGGTAFQRSAPQRMAAAQKIVEPAASTTLNLERSAERYNHEGERSLVREPTGVHFTEKGIREGQIAAMDTIGKAIGDTLQLPQNQAQAFDRQPIIDAEYSRAVRSAQERGDLATVTKLGNVRDAMLDPGLYGASSAPLPDQHDFGVKISGHTEFTDNKAGDAIVNQFRQGVRRGVQNEIVARVPELGGEGGLNQRYGDAADEVAGMERKRQGGKGKGFLEGGLTETAGRAATKPGLRYGAAKLLTLDQRYEPPQVARPIFQGQVMPPAAPAPAGQQPPYAAPPIPHNTQPQLPPGPGAPKQLTTGGPPIVTPPPNLLAEPYYDWRTGKGPAEAGPEPTTVYNGKGVPPSTAAEQGGPYARPGSAEAGAPPEKPQAKTLTSKAKTVEEAGKSPKNAVKPLSRRMQTPEAAATASPHATAAPETQEARVQKVADAIIQSDKNASPIFAEKRARQLIAADSGEPKYTGPERRQAGMMLDKYEGPERRAQPEEPAKTEQEPAKPAVKPLSGTAGKLDQIKKSTNWEFLKATKDNEKLPTAMRRAAQERMGWITGPPEYYYSTEDVEAAKREAQGAVELSDTLGRPGRYFAESTPEEHALTGRENKGNGERAGGSWFSISAQKGNIAEQFPWFKDTSASEVKAALEAGKGAAYNKIVGKIAKGIEGERLAAEPILKEYEPKLRDAAANVKDVDPELSQALTDIADRKMRVGATGLKKFLEEKLDDASQAAEFSKAFDEATGEATETAEAAGSSDQPREPLSEKEIEGALPGMSGHIREQQAVAGTEQARDGRRQSRSKASQ